MLGVEGGKCVSKICIFIMSFLYPPPKKKAASYQREKLLCWICVALARLGHISYAKVLLCLYYKFGKMYGRRISSGKLGLWTINPHASMTTDTAYNVLYVDVTLFRLLTLGITTLILDKTYLKLVVQFPCLLGHPV